MLQRTTEQFLEDALGLLQRNFSAIGRVLVAAKDDAIADERDCVALAQELEGFLREQRLDPAPLQRRQWHDFELPDKYPLLKKYLLVITVCPEHTGDPWVQVLPASGFLEHWNV